MFDLSLFRKRAFTGVSLATFAIGAGMFAMLPFLTLYLQDCSATRRSRAGCGSCR